MSRLTSGSVVLALALAACEGTGPDVGRACDDEAVVVLDSALRLEGGDVRVDGLAETSTGIAIRAITVEGVAATSQSFNFSRFSVALDEAQLPPAAEQRECEAQVGPDQVCLRVLASKSCGEIDESWHVMTVRGAMPPRLALEAPRWVVPEDGSAAITVVVGTETGDADAHLRLTTPAGGSGAASFTAAGTETELDLELDPTATVVVYGRAAGFVVLEATAERADPVRQILTVAGPPRFSPPALQAPAGSSFRFTVESEAMLERCQSFGPAEVRIEGMDASLGAPLEDPIADGEVDVPAGTTDATTVRCWDEFGQDGEAVFQPAAGAP